MPARATACDIGGRARWLADSANVTNR